MNNKELNNKFFNDEGKTFAEWKEWVRKAKPTQAEAHVVQATLKNGKKFDRVYGNYVDAQNNAFALKHQLGAKNVKLFKSVNGGPLKLERSFDSSDQFDADEKFFFEVLSRNGRLISRIKAPETISKAIAFRLADQESAKYKKPWAKCRIVNSKGHSFESFNRNFKVNEFVAKNMDSADEPSLISRIADKYAIDAVFPTSKGFANEKGLLKRDTRKGLKPYEVTFVVKGKDGRPFNTKRSKMAASLDEAKKWAQAESKKYNGVTKIDVKEFKDSADEFANDVMTYPVKSNRNGSKYGYIEKICKTKAEAEALVESLKKKGFIANYKGVRSFDSSDTLDRVREKYAMDAIGAGVVNPNFKFNTNVERRLATTRRGSSRVMTLPQYGKPSKVTVKKDGNSFSVFGKDGQKLSKSMFKTYEEAEKWARSNGFMIEKR